MGYQIDPTSANYYPGTTVLVNRFGIRDENALNQVEAVLVTARNTEWLASPKQNTFDFSHYCAIHQYLFSDLYDWAGKIRTVDIGKKGTAFCPVAEIPTRAFYIFQRLAKLRASQPLDQDSLCFELADLYDSINLLHPFREGNGRTQRAFFTQLAQSLGYHLNWSEADPDLLMIATIQAAHGSMDLLKNLFDALLHKL